MARFFSLKVAPGIRLSASARGLRGHIGPRAARLHVGGGGTGVSTGAGPFTWYESMNGPSSAGPTKQAAAARPLPVDERTSEMKSAQCTFDALASSHRRFFPTLHRQVAPLSPLPDFGDVLALAVQGESSGVSRFDRSARAAARDRARALAERWALTMLAEAHSQRDVRQSELDAAWNNVIANVPETLLTHLRSTFAASGSPVRVHAITGDSAALVVRVPEDDVVPARRPALTPTGRPTLAKLNKTERAHWHRQDVASHVLLAAKHALATAPALLQVEVAAVIPNGSAVLVAGISREALNRVSWEQDAWSVLGDVAPGLRSNLSGRTGALGPVRLDEDDDETYGLSPV